MPPAAPVPPSALADDLVPFTLLPGRSPLLVSIPHCGTALPPELAARLQDRALEVEDTDWFLDRLYGFVSDRGAGLLLPRYSRYLIDLNRPPEDTPMYAGRNNTGLCPTTFFTGEPLYRPGLEPDAEERRLRIERYWHPYHRALEGELLRLRELHGHATLLDAHSIRSELPWLFEGTLPHLNLGTADGRSCAPQLREAVRLACEEPRYDCVVDERFKGGYITRRYGRPAEGLHAVQLEMCWRAYMDESPPAWNDARAAQVRPLLERLVDALVGWRPT